MRESGFSGMKMWHGSYSMKNNQSLQMTTDQYEPMMSNDD